MRWKVLVLLLAVMAVLIMGCAGNGEDTMPPSIEDVQVNQTQIRFSGGEVVISARVKDASGIAIVWAKVQKPDGTIESVLLSLGGNRYEAKITTAPNTTYQSQIYRVWVKAMDTKGNKTPDPGEPRDGLTIEVKAPPLPPEAPTF